MTRAECEAAALAALKEAGPGGLTTGAVGHAIWGGSKEADPGDGSHYDNKYCRCVTPVLRSLEAKGLARSILIEGPRARYRWVTT